MVLSSDIPSFVHAVLTPFGPVCIVWRDSPPPCVVRVFLSSLEADAGELASVAFPGSRPGADQRIVALADLTVAFLEGVPVSLPISMARLDLCSAFQRRILETESTIPRGSFSTYSLLAAAVSSPTASRAAGTALATNPFPLIVPCHRVVRSDGTPGGYQGGCRMKRRLLEMEGASFDASGRILGGPCWP